MFRKKHRLIYLLIFSNQWNYLNIEIEMNKSFLQVPLARGN